LLPLLPASHSSPSTHTLEGEEEDKNGIDGCAVKWRHDSAGEELAVMVVVMMMVVMVLNSDVRDDLYWGCSGCIDCGDCGGGLFKCI
jgi:hypothetical protein